MKGAKKKPAEEAALGWAVEAGLGDELVRQIDGEVRRSRRRRAYAIAGACLVLAVAALVWRPWENANRRSPALLNERSYIVRAPRREILPDGSVAELRGTSRIAVDFSPGERRVIMDGGEAYFQVVKNPARPFVVLAGDVEARDVGTAFSVQVGAGSVEVLVDEGRVAVTKKALSATTVGAGNRIVLSLVPGAPGAGAIVPVSKAEMKRLLSWRVPQLEFTGTPLSVVIPLFNRYGGSHLSLDPALGKLQISGILRTDSTDALLQLLKHEFSIVAERRGEAEVLLRQP